MSTNNQLVTISLSPIATFSPISITLQLLNGEFSLPCTLQGTTKRITMSFTQSDTINACEIHLQLADIFIHSITETQQLYIMLETYEHFSPLTQLAQHCPQLATALKLQQEQSNETENMQYDTNKIYSDFTFTIHDIPESYLELTFDEEFEQEIDVVKLRQSPINLLHHIFTQLIRLTPDTTSLSFNDNEEIDLQNLTNALEMSFFTDGFYTEHGFVPGPGDGNDDINDNDEDFEYYHRPTE